jgi:hypothetical protein
MVAEKQALQQEARKGMTADEAEFSVEAALDNQVYLWSDKYCPRKPCYFNWYIFESSGFLSFLTHELVKQE